MGGDDTIANIVLLTAKEHYIVHRLLTKIYPNNKKLLYAVWRLSNYNFIPNSKVYETIRKEIAKVQSTVISVIDNDGNTLQVRKDDERYLSGELKGINYNKVLVTDSLGNAFIVEKTDERYLCGELKAIATGKVSVKDEFNNTYQVATDDERYLNGELTHINKNKVTLKNSNGDTIRVDKNDERYLSGELVGLSKGCITVKNPDGECFRVDKDDERYLSGELVGINKGFSHSEESKHKMSNSRKGKPSKNNKQIIYEGVKYNSITEASKILKKSRSTLRKLCLFL